MLVRGRLGVEQGSARMQTPGHPGTSTVSEETLASVEARRMAGLVRAFERRLVTTSSGSVTDALKDTVGFQELGIVK